MLRGKAENLVLPDLPITGPLTMQLVNDDPTCWEATYSIPSKNTDTAFSAKSD